MKTLITFNAEGRHTLSLRDDPTKILGYVQHDLSTGELWRAWGARPETEEVYLGVFEDDGDAWAAIIEDAEREAG
jgi:hypothetical protein